MSVLIQELNHRIIEPSYYHRQFKNDLPRPSPTGEHSWQEIAKRCALIAIPFLSLYRPFGMAISLSMGATRCVTSIYNAWQSGQRTDLLQCGAALFQTTIAVLSIAATIFSFPIGLILISAVDTLTSAATFIQCLASGQWEEGLEELLQTTIGCLYCASMLSGHLEIVLVIALVQAFVSIYQARREFTAERYPEAIAKILMSMVRIGQSKTVFDQIQRRDLLFSIEKNRRLNERANQGKRNVGHLSENPLQNLTLKVKDNEVVLTDADGNPYSFGSHFHSHGKALVKGANLNFRQVTVNGEKKIELDFKVNHLFRTQIQQTIDEMNTLNPSEIQEILRISHSHASDIRITNGSFPVGNKLIGSSTEIHLEGLGKITLGASALYPNLHDRVIVQLDEGKSLYAWHETLAFLDLNTALCTSTQEDLARLKIGQLFRTVHPREAMQLERSAPFFDLPIDQLKEQIVHQAPDMKEIFERDLDRMEQREILPGRVRYAIPGLSEQSRQLGARSLTGTITGAYTQDTLFNRVGSMLKMGMLSSETRYSNRIQAHGLSPSADFYTGGADSVYTQMIMAEQCDRQIPFDRFYYDSPVRLLISLDALETGTYQYYGDSFGTRRPEWGYSDRPSITEFITNYAQEADGGHEICFKERIPPEYIQGIVVKNSQTRDNLLNYLRQKQIVQTDSRGIETILNRPADQFIRVSTHVSNALVSV